MLGELSQKYPAESTENANAEEKTVSREELVKNVNKAQDAYDIAEEEYNASKTLVESYKEEGFETIAKIFFEQLTQELEKAYNDHIK